MTPDILIGLDTGLSWLTQPSVRFPVELEHEHRPEQQDADIRPVKHRCA